MKTPAPRKLCLPGKLAIPRTEPQVTEPEPMPACVAPRRRFVLRFLGVCAALTLVGIFIHSMLFYTPAEEAFWDSILSLISWVLPCFVILCIPARTRRATLLQLLGLIIPLSLTIIAIGFWWSEPKGLYDGLDMGFGIVIITIPSILYLYLPAIAVHFIIRLIEIYRKHL